MGMPLREAEARVQRKDTDTASNRFPGDVIDIRRLVGYLYEYVTVDGAQVAHAPKEFILAVVLVPNAVVATAYLGGYFLVRSMLTVLVGSLGLKQRGVWAKLALIPAWDAVATLIWLTSFARRSIFWRGHRYAIVNGCLVPAERVQSNSTIQV